MAHTRIKASAAQRRQAVAVVESYADDLNQLCDKAGFSISYLRKLLQADSPDIENMARSTALAIISCDRSPEQDNTLRSRIVAKIEKWQEILSELDRFEKDEV